MSGTSQSAQCPTCHVYVKKLNQHQRIHRDGIYISTPGGKKKVYRTDGRFRCERPGCPYVTDDACSFQKHATRHANEQEFASPALPASLLLSTQATDDDPSTADQHRGEGSSTETSDVDMVDDVLADHNEAAEMGPDTTLMDVEVESDADEELLESRDQDEDYVDEADEGQCDIPSAGWSEDTVQTDAMARLGICVNSAARVIVCIACSSSLTPLELPGHLSRTHRPLSTTAAFSKELATTYNLRKDLVSRPGRIITAIYGLGLVDGFLVCDTCGWACKSDQTMGRHMKASQNCKSFCSRPVQTFRPTTKRCYFGVVSEPECAEDSAKTPLDPLTYLRKKLAPTSFSDIPIGSPKSARDANRFLALEKWDLYVQGRTGAEIMDILREREPEFRKDVRVCVERFAANVTLKLTKVDNEVRAAMGNYVGIGLSRSKLMDLQNEQTRKSYSKVATDLVVFCLGVMTGDIHQFKTEFTEDMSKAGAAFSRALQRSSISNQDTTLQHLLFSLFTQKRCGQTANFGILAFAFLVLYSFTKDGNLQQCNNFTQHFSKTIFFGRGAIFAHIFAEAERDNKGFFEVHKTYQHLLLIQSDYPLSPMYSAKNLAKRISRDQERETKVSFVGPGNKTAILGKIKVKVATFGEWYHKLLAELKEMQVDLFGGVGFENEEWVLVTVPDILLDEVNTSTPGFCFGDLDSNHLKYEDASLRTLFHHPDLKDRFGTMIPSGRFVPNPVGCHDFLARSSHARTKLATLLHISCGGPARGTEITTHYLRNHQQGDIRNVMVIDGRLCLVSGYNKTSSTAERQKKIYRFIPESLYRVCIIDWFVIRPVEIILAGALELEPAVEALRFRLFPGVSHPFTSDALSKCLKRDSQLHIGQGINLSDFRDLQSNIVDEHKDPEAVGINVRENASILQQGHTTAIAETYYNLRPDNPHGVGRDRIKAFLRASGWWQNLTGIQQLESAAVEKTNHHSGSVALASISTIQSQLNQLTSKIDGLSNNMRLTVNESIESALALQAGRCSNVEPSSQAQQELYVPHPSLMRMLRTFLANPTATFKTAEQAEAIEFVLACKRHLFLVGPTAMGKTFAYLLPAANQDHGITCILLPLSVPDAVFDQRCQDLGIESSRWTPRNNEPRTKIVYVSPGNAQTQQFTDYLAGLQSLGILKQFVIDEVHLVKSRSDFRSCFSVLKPLLRDNIPFLLMTATCPPSLRLEILSVLGIEDCHVIHAPTDRPEISYRVKIFPTLERARDKLVAAVRSQLAHQHRDSFRGLVYCQSKTDVDEIADMIGCGAFHASQPEEEKQVNFRNWVEGKKKFMVCSSSMGCGIDVEGVTAVFHFGTPWSLLYFAQESGRAGRGGNASLSIIFAAENERTTYSEEGVDLHEKQVMRDWVLQKSACRRTGLSSFLDNRRTTCMLLKGAVLCDICLAESLKEHPGQLTLFPSLIAPTRDETNPITLPTIQPSLVPAQATQPSTTPATTHGPTTSNNQTRKWTEKPTFVHFPTTLF